MTKECKKAQGVVLIPLVILIAILLLASSCASSNYQSCAADSSVEVKSGLK